MDFSRYINKIYVQFTSSLTQLVIVYHAVRQTEINTTILLQISALQFYRGFFVLNMAFASTALRIATLSPFITHIRFPASDFLIDVLRKRYGRDLLKEVKTLEKVDF